MFRKIAVTLVIALGMILVPSVASAADISVATNASSTPAPSVPAGGVLDEADMFTPEQEKNIQDSFVANYQESGLVFVVETVGTIDGANLRNYTISRANTLGVGEADKDNGVFMLLVRDDRLFQIEPGINVAPVVSESQFTSIVDNVALPSFKNGDYVGGIIGSANATSETFLNPSSSSATSGPGFDWGAFFIWTGIILGGIALIVVGIFVTIAVVRYTARRRQREEDARYAEYSKAVYDVANVAGNHYEFFKAGNKLERTNFVRKELADYISRHPESADEAVAEATAKAMARALRDKVQKTNASSSYLSSYSPDVEAQSLDAYFSSDVFKSQVKSAIDSEKAYQARQREIRLQEAERQRAAEKARKAKEKDAKDFWKGLSASQKQQIKSARTKSDKQRVMASYNTTGMDMNFVFPFLLGMYASEIGRSESAYASSSSSSYGSSSSSSSYSSYDSGSSFSSFSGGGFDGGGGGGSW